MGRVLTEPTIKEKLRERLGERKRERERERERERKRERDGDIVSVLRRLSVRVCRLL